MRIDAAATEHHRGLVFGRGALHLSDAAARACLARGHHEAGDLDILVNAGIYKDRNTAEPALASIIQEDLGANPGHPPRLGHHGTFAFDILNGGCGVVTGAQLVDGFVGHGPARLGMVVAADADPSPRTSHGFPFRAAGGAVLFGHVDDDVGFERFSIRTFPEDADLFQVHLRWDPDAGLMRRGRNVLVVEEAPGFAARCVARAIEVTTELLGETGLAPSDIDLLVASQYPRRFDRDVARGLGLSDACVPRVPAGLTRTHTAGPIAALEAAIDAGLLARARHTLFVTAGAGVTIGAALYRGQG